jgi:hypothetical protein
MRPQHLFILVAVGVISAILGYSLGFGLAAESIVSFFAGSGSGEWERGVVGEIAIQAICAGPLLVALGAVLGTLAAVLDRLLKSSIALRSLIVILLAFVGGFVLYFPFQVLLLVAAAF